MAQSCAEHAQNFSSLPIPLCTVHRMYGIYICITMSKTPRKSRRRNKYAPRDDSFAQPLLNHVVQTETAIIDGFQEHTGRGGIEAYVN